MSFFDFSKPKVFDIKKRFGNFERMEDNADPGSSAESWVELAPSRTSLCSSVDQSIILIDDKQDKDSRLSPVSLQSPHVEFENLEQVKYRLVRDMLPPGKNTDWIWDWSARPEALPAKSLRNRQYGSNVTTPPNSPEPELNAFPFSIDKEGTGISVRFFFGFLVSNIVTFVIGAAIGFIHVYQSPQSSCADIFSMAMLTYWPSVSRCRFVVCKRLARHGQL